MTGQTLGAVREVSLLIVFNFNYQPSKLDITKTKIHVCNNLVVTNL
jgi:hypothetical protein